MKPFIPEKIFIEKKVLDTEVTRNILSYFSLLSEQCPKPKNILRDDTLRCTQGDRESVQGDRIG